MFCETISKALNHFQIIRIQFCRFFTAHPSIQIIHTKEQILDAWKNYKGIPQQYDLPSAPKQFITYFEEDNRPQAKLDRDIEGGMGVSAGRLREDTVYDYKFVGLAHNTLRGAAGGAVLEAETLVALGYITAKN